YVDRGVDERLADLRWRAAGVLLEEERGDRGGVGSRGRRAEERIVPGNVRRDAVEGHQIRLGAGLRRRIEDRDRARRAEGLDGVVPRIPDVHGADGDHLRERWMSDDASSGRDVLLRRAAEAEEAQGARLAPRQPDRDAGVPGAPGGVPQRDDLDGVL